MKKILLLCGIALFHTSATLPNKFNITSSGIEFDGGSFYFSSDTNSTNDVDTTDTQQERIWQELMDMTSRLTFLYEAESVDPENKPETTKITGVSGTIGTTAKTGDTEKYRYEDEKTDYLYSNIYSNIKTIEKALFGARGLATKSIFSNKDKFSFYFQINNSIISHAFFELTANIINFCYLPLSCQRRETGITEATGMIGHTHKFDLHGPEVKRNLENAYDRLVDLFQNMGPIHDFIHRADCQIKSNDAILSFMRHQIQRDADLITKEFEKAYITFMAAVQKSFVDGQN